MYTAIVFDPETEQRLQELMVFFPYPHSVGWVLYGHHVTICMGTNSKKKFPFGEKVEIKVVGLGHTLATDIPEKKRKGIDDMEAKVAFAALVELPEGKFIKNDSPHITLGVNWHAGGKPVHSNYAQWYSGNHQLNAKEMGFNPFTVTGTVEVCGA